MDNVLQSQLDEIEKALTALVDSIVAYNPSILAASNLLTADDGLQASLKQLVRHQKNHARILALHERISQHNALITSSVTALADTRADLLSIPTSLPPKRNRDVPYREILDYAKLISRYTAPPGSRSNIPLSEVSAATAPAVNGDTQGEKIEAEEGKGIGTAALEDEERKWLEPLKQIPFVPWVSDDVVRKGALAQIQARVERGEDPADVKPEEAQNQADEGESIEEEKERIGDSSMISGAVPGGREGELRRERPVEKPAVFGGLDLYDPMNDD